VSIKTGGDDNIGIILLWPNMRTSDDVFGLPLLYMCIVFHCVFKFLHWILHKNWTPLKHGESIGIVSCK